MKITQELINTAFEKNLLCASYLVRGKWICVDVVEEGYIIPHTASVIETQEYAQKAANAHNRYAGFTVNQANKFISKSMKTSLQNQSKTVEK